MGMQKSKLESPQELIVSHGQGSRLSMGSPLEVNQMHYEVTGQPQQPTLVLIHGLDSAGATFENVVPALAKNYQVLVYDQRGHGQTQAKGLNYSSQLLAEDLKNLLDHLRIKQAHLLGHSMGARTALRFATSFPERVKSLVIEDMEMSARTPYTEAAEREMLAAHFYRQGLFPESHYKDLQALVTALESLYSSQSIDSLISRRARAESDGSYQLLFRPEVQILYGTQGNAENLNPLLAEVAQPVLILRADPAAGSAISESGLAEMVKAKPEVEVKMIPGSGHTVHRTNPQEFLEVLADFQQSNTTA